MLRIYTGRNRLLAPALLQALRMETDAQMQIIVVPKQLTLQTERMLLAGLNLRGSFRLQVLSAERFCARIFEQTGQPDGVRVDERGRVMLVRAAIRAAAPQLTLYRGAEHRRGFPERAAAQLERIRQAGVNAETLRACAAEQSGAAAMKLNDLSYILEAYQMLTEGRYQDGESEFIAAIAQAAHAEFLRTADVYFYGFDMVPPTLHELMAAIGAVCSSAAVFMPLENDENSRDYDAFLPMRRALERLCHAARLAGAAVERVRMEEAPEVSEAAFPASVFAGKRRIELVHLERELFAFPAEPLRTSGGPRSVQITMPRNPIEECMYAAALARRLAVKRGYRWSDILILCRDVEKYEQPLRTAFRTYGVPLFLSSSRAAARHALAECLLTALKCIEKNFPADDVLALMRTGYMPLTDDEAGRLANHIHRTGLRGQRFLRPLRRGSEAELAELEPVRARLIAPLVHLRDGLRHADGLHQQLTAIFGFLTEIGACETGMTRQQKLIDAGMRELAGEESQVWNRLMGAMDQMAALMGTERLSLRELGETLTESLAAAVIKPLPQSGDSVYAQTTERMCSAPARAIVILGATDRAVTDDEGLLSPSQRQTLSAFAGAYLGPDDADLSRMRRFYMKSALGMASEYVAISCPLSGMDNSAQRPSAMIDMIRALLPDLTVRGGVTGDPSVEKMLRSTPAAAAAFAARALSDEAGGVRAGASDRAALAGLAKLAPELDEARAALGRLSAALNRRAAADVLHPETARALYGAIHRTSITRLEQFANCPFAYFTQQGLHPDRVEPFDLNARDEGSFFHGAVNEFLLRSMEDLNDLDPETAQQRMDGIADALLDAMGTTGPLGDSAVNMAERRRLKATARACAAALADHMRGSLFHTTALEQDFGWEDGAHRIELPGGCILEGRIDRIDEWSDYLRVIDYKRGGRALKLSEAYYGLRLQLPVYLAAAMKKRGAQSAGVYYFSLDEGILATQATDPNAVEAERRKNFRMEGLLPEDPQLLGAMSPHFEDVVKARMTAGGTLYKGTLCTDEKGFAALTRHAVRCAAGHLQRIREGHAEIAPARLEQSNPCAWCDYRPVCLFDDRLDAGCIRKFKPIRPEEVLERLILSDNDGEKK